MAFIAQECQSYVDEQAVTSDLLFTCPDCASPAQLIEVQNILRDMEGEQDDYPRFHLSCFVCEAGLPPSQNNAAQRNAFLLSEIQKIEDKEAKGCGLYYEIYHKRVITALDRLDDTLSLEDSLRLRTIAAARGWSFSQAELLAADEEYDSLLKEIHDVE